MVKLLAYYSCNLKRPSKPALWNFAFYFLTAADIIELHQRGVAEQPCIVTLSRTGAVFISFRARRLITKLCICISVVQLLQFLWQYLHQPLINYIFLEPIKKSVSSYMFACLKEIFRNDQVVTIVGLILCSSLLFVRVARCCKHDCKIILFYDLW